MDYLSYSGTGSFLNDELLVTFFCHVVELKMSILQHQV